MVWEQCELVNVAQLDTMACMMASSKWHQRRTSISISPVLVSVFNRYLMTLREGQVEFIAIPKLRIRQFDALESSMFYPARLCWSMGRGYRRHVHVAHDTC